MGFKMIKVRIYPTVKQKQVLDNHFNAYRFCYNLALDYKSIMWKDYKIRKSGYDLAKEILEIRKTTPWLMICKAECVRHAGIMVDKSIKKFFNGNGYPKFKSKRGEQSFVSNQSLRIINNKIKFFSLSIKFKSSISISETLTKSKIKSCTFKKDKCGDYWASCLIDFAPNKLRSLNTSIGLDMGIKDLIVTSENDVFENKKYLISSKFKIRKLKRRFSKTKKSGKNRNKIAIKISRLHRKLTNQKQHYYHDITNKIIRDNQMIVIEELNIKGMLKNPKLARNINDASWGLLTKQLEYKSQWYGRNLIKIDRWFPSSKTCSDCGNVKEVLSLGTRTYDCECCGLSIDRDWNAAINIRNAGLKIPEVPTEDTVNGQAYEVGSNSIIFNN